MSNCACQIENGELKMVCGLHIKYAETIAKHAKRKVQAKLDAIMLEWCPNEMSKEQLEEWVAAQRPSTVAEYIHRHTKK